MRIETMGNHWVIVRGTVMGNLHYFSFYLDHDSSSWTQRSHGDVRKFPTEKMANDALVRLKARAKIRREERKQRAARKDQP